MKVLLVFLGLILAASALPYSLSGGYKTSSKYIYHYEGRIRPAQLPLLENQFIELYLNATVVLHPISNAKFVLKIPKHTITAKVSDPKYTDGPVLLNERYGEIEALKEHIRRPVVFIYTNGIIRRILAHKLDKPFSVNLKRGILNLLNVEIQGKDPETGRDDLFTKPEMTVIGKCQTSYSILDFNLVNANRKLTRVGYNVTKVVDLNNCSSVDYEVLNKVVPGPNENQATNPMQSSATIKHNIIGDKKNFKIEEVHAVGMHVLYLVGKEEGGITSVTDQRLKLVKSVEKTLKKQDIAKLERQLVVKHLKMDVRSFGNLEYVPALSEQDQTNIIELVHVTLVKLVKLLPSPIKPATTVDGKDTTGTLLPKVSDMILTIIEALRKVDKKTHSMIWTKCSTTTDMKKWTVYLMSLCGTQHSMEFMREVLPSLPEELIADYLISVAFIGKPSKMMAKVYLRGIIEIEKIKQSPYLTKLAYIAASGMLKTYTIQKQQKVTTLWFDKVLTDALKKIPTICVQGKVDCQPITHLPATVVLAIAENMERPQLFPFLDAIVRNELLPLEIRIKAVLALRPLVRIIPHKVHVTMLRVFRDITYDTELRSIAFAVIMDCPTPQIILHIARTIRLEPSLILRRFVYDKLVSIRLAKTPYSPKIISVVKIALNLYSKWMVPSQWLTKTNCLHLNWFSKNWTVGATWQHEQIHKTNFLPSLVATNLNVTIFGRNINVLEAQLRLEGVQEYLTKLFGPSGYWGDKQSIFDFLRTKRSLSEIVETIEDLKRKVPTFTVPDEKLRIFSQLKMFGKIFHVNETSVDQNVDLKSLFLTGSILRAVELERELKEGKTFEFSKPYMPIEVIYRMPSLIGVTMTANLTSIILPVSSTVLKAEVKPGLFTPKSLLWKQRDSVHVSAEHRLNAIADVRGQIDFRIPGIRVGGKIRTFVNVSTHLKASIDYDFKTRQLKTEIETPKQIREVLLVQRNASHFLKANSVHVQWPRIEENKTLRPTFASRTVEFDASEDVSSFDSEYLPPTASPLTPTAPLTPTTETAKPTIGSRYIQVPIEVDQLGETKVYGMTKSPKVSEGWTLKVNGKFISVNGEKVVLTNVPFVWTVTFYRAERRIASFKTPDNKFLTMAVSKDCVKAMKLKRTNGALFVVTETAPNVIKIQSVASMTPPVVPKPWGIAKPEEIAEMKEVKRIFNKEMVSMWNKKKVHEEIINPNSQKARMAYLMAKGESLCVSPFAKDSIIVEVERKQPFSEVLKQISYQKGDCISSAYGIQTCVHGYLPQPRLNHLPMLYAPMAYRLLLKPALHNIPEKFLLSVKLPEPTAPIQIYEAIISVNPATKVLIHAEYNPSVATTKLTVTPTKPQLLKFSRFCLSLSVLPDNVHLTASFDRACRRKNINVVSILKPRDLPRFWAQINVAYDPIQVPKYVLDVLKYVTEVVVIPTLKSTALVFPRPNPSAEYDKMTKLDIQIPTNKTLRLRLKTKNYIFLMDDIKLPSILTTLPKGSKQVSFLKKLAVDLLRPRCLHKDTSFVTFDKRPFNFTLRGHCEHQLLRMCDQNSSNIAVLARKLDMGLRRVVTVLVDSYKVEVMPNINMHTKPRVSVNNKPVEFLQRHEVLDANRRPVITIIWEKEPQILSIEDHKYNLSVSLMESHIVSLRVNPLFTSKTCGLCGNNDGEQHNEFVTPEGQIIADVRRPTLLQPIVKPTAERIFGSTWIVPGRSCSKACPFIRDFVTLKPEEVKGKTCLSNYKIIQCASKCTESSLPEITHVPMTCVPESEIPQLKQHLTKGKKLSVSDAVWHLAKISIPRECKCTC
eukprot:gene7835-8685_t